jgi:hypothetical protein
LGKGSLEECGFQSEEGLLQLEGFLAEDDFDIASVVLGEEGLQLLSSVGQTDFYLLVHH